MTWYAYARQRCFGDWLHRWQPASSYMAAWCAVYGVPVKLDAAGLGNHPAKELTERWMT